MCRVIKLLKRLMERTDTNPHIRPSPEILESKYLSDEEPCEDRTFAERRNRV